MSLNWYKFSKQVVSDEEYEKNLRSWFGNSLVTDNKGDPLIVYHHGSFDEEFDVPEIDFGMHFGTEDAARQRAYGKISDNMIKSLEIFYDEEDGSWHWETDDGISSIDYGVGFNSAAEARENGEEVSTEIAENTLDDAEDLGHFFEAFLRIENPIITSDKNNNWSNFIKEAKKGGYDGIIYKNQYEDKGSESYIVFEPNQVKSINNDGTFDSNDSNVLS